MRGLTTAVGYNTLYFCYGGALALVCIPLVIDIRKTKTVNPFILTGCTCRYRPRACPSKCRLPGPINAGKFETVARLQSMLLGERLMRAAESQQKPRFNVWVRWNRNPESVIG